MADGERVFSSNFELLNKIVCITMMHTVKRKLLRLAQPLEAFGQLREGEGTCIRPSGTARQRGKRARERHRMTSVLLSLLFFKIRSMRKEKT